jgi:tRNA nucleotidyltransferase (CCA-adding enzyme)
MLQYDNRNFTKVSLNIQKSLKDIFNFYPEIPKIIDLIDEAGGRAYFVGGTVRDLLISREINDIDIEVHYLSLEVLSNILSQFGAVNYVGKAFGILKLNNSKVDWALPRTDSSGRKPLVTIDPFLDIVDALRRRDLTINAIAIDLVTLDLIDPFNGAVDLQSKILRSPDISFFGEDPLRFYRVMQFIARFEAYPDEELTKTCATMDISKVSIERIETEFKKMFLKSHNPSLGIRWLDNIGRLEEILPILYETKFTEQDPIWHPEGFVFEHLMQTLDATALMASNHEFLRTDDEKLILMYAGLLHDLGKISTTIFSKGRIRSPGHAEVGAPLAKSMLKKITGNKSIIDTVGLLVKYHMLPGQFIECNALLGAYRRLALKLKGHTNLKMLSLLTLADRRGRNPESYQPLTENYDYVHKFIENAKAAGVLESSQEPILKGKDISDLINPGVQMGELLKYAYKLQISQGILDKDILRQKIIQKLEKN